VVFDPDLDVAVLRVGAAGAEPLGLLSATLDRGETGAVLGYPGGGDLTGGAAAVRRTLIAIGRDIYGEDTVRREVYELQAFVRPGNSGGPFVTPSGQVAGVVFAASTADDGVGYAILSQDVMPRVEQAAGRGAPVSTGPCLR
jgi:S1-C subfamily serine protease